MRRLRKYRPERNSLRQVRATKCPRISKEFPEEQRSVMGSESFRQEHLREFTGSGMGAFERDLVEAALDDDVEPI